MKSLKDTLRQNREMSLEEKESLADKIHETKTAAIVEQPAVVAVARDSKSVHRLTLDLPTWLVDKMKIETERNGQTMRGLILTMLLDKFKE